MIKSYSSLSFARVALWVVALVGGLGLSQVSLVAAEEEKGTFFGSVVVPAGLTLTEVQDVAIATLQGRQWGVKSKADGAVVGYLKHRSNEATVTLAFDTSKVDIYCVGYQIDKKTGVREKPELPKGWLKNIQADLTKHFNRSVTVK